MRHRDGTTSVSKILLVSLLLVGMISLSLLLVSTVIIPGNFYGARNSYLFTSRATPAGGIEAGIRSLDRAGDYPAKNPQWMKAVDFHYDVFHSLIVEGFLSLGSRSLCVGSPGGGEAFRLKEIGVHDVVGAESRNSPPLIVPGDPLQQPLRNVAFDFVFATMGIIEGSMQQGDLAAELERMLKPGGFLVVHTSSAGDAYSLSSLLALLPSCRLVRSREIAGFGSVPLVREIVLQKDEEGRRVVHILGRKGKEKDGSGGTSKTSLCPIPEHKLELLNSAEPLVKEEPLDYWKTMVSNAAKIKYLPSNVDINFKRKYVYIDVGARDYESSIGSWFQKKYPKQNRTFEIYAFEADSLFYPDYATKTDVKLMPFAAWVRNETVQFKALEHKSAVAGQVLDSYSGSMAGQVNNVQGIDFAEWLKNTVSEIDFVVMKIDVEGAEFKLMPRLAETGAICLVDELIMECHYNWWMPDRTRNTKVQANYSQCLDMFSSLREGGVLVHQWM